MHAHFPSFQKEEQMQTFGNTSSAGSSACLDLYRLESIEHKMYEAGDCQALVLVNSKVNAGIHS